MGPCQKLDNTYAKMWTEPCGCQHQNRFAANLLCKHLDYNAAHDVLPMKRIRIPSLGARPQNPWPRRIILPKKQHREKNTRNHRMVTKTICTRCKNSPATQNSCSIVCCGSLCIVFPQKRSLSIIHATHSAPPSTSSRPSRCVGYTTLQNPTVG